MLLAMIGVRTSISKENFSHLLVIFQRGFAPPSPRSAYKPLRIQCGQRPIFLVWSNLCVCEKRMSGETAQARLGFRCACVSGISCVCRRNTCDVLFPSLLYSLRVLLILYATTKFDTNHADSRLILLLLMRSREGEQKTCLYALCEIRKVPSKKHVPSRQAFDALTVSVIPLLNPSFIILTSRCS